MIQRAVCRNALCRPTTQSTDTVTDTVTAVSYTHLVAAYRDKYAASEYSSSQKSDDVTGSGASAYTTNVYGNVSAYSRSDNVVSQNYDKDYYDGCRETTLSERESAETFP